ncbi:MAG TPA: RNA chaperone Hfq [Candidatus Acidoferrales bacterium]
MVNRKLFRPTLTDVKEQQFPARAAAPAPQAVPQRKKPAPPEQTHAENFYFVKQMQSRTSVAVVLTDGEIVHGSVEWYDRDCIKLTRVGSPNLLLYKHVIKYIYKDGEDAAQGGSSGLNGAHGSNGSNGSNGHGHHDED